MRANPSKSNRQFARWMKYTLQPNKELYGVTFLWKSKSVSKNKDPHFFMIFYNDPQISQKKPLRSRDSANVTHID